MSAAGGASGGQFNILYFASASSHTQKDSESLPAPLPLSRLFSELESRYHGFQAKILDSCLVTVNLDYVDVPETGATDGGVVIKAGDEVAIIPPVSSG